jgi:hypothetical protein
MALDVKKVPNSRFQGLPPTLKLRRGKRPSPETVRGRPPAREGFRSWQRDNELVFPSRSRSRGKKPQVIPPSFAQASVRQAAAGVPDPVDSGCNGNPDHNRDRFPLCLRRLRGNSQFVRLPNEYGRQRADRNFR